jgi:GMP synthase-like glutamine amidotransferase
MANVLVVRHHPEDNPGHIGEGFEALGHTLHVVTVDENTPTPSLDGMDYLLMLGSKDSVYDEEVKSKWLDSELAMLREADKRGLGIFGVCFGAQELCVLSGGHVEKTSQPEVGWFNVQSLNDKVPGGAYMEYHFDHCVLPDDVEVLAKNENAVQAFAFGRHFGVQFHPEVDEHQLNDWFNIAGDDDARDAGTSVPAILETARELEQSSRERGLALVEYFLSR